MDKKTTDSSSWFDGNDLLNQILLLLIGVVILMVNFGFLDRQILMYWPVLLIVISLRGLLQHR